MLTPDGLRIVCLLVPIGTVIAIAIFASVVTKRRQQKQYEQIVSDATVAWDSGDYAAALRLAIKSLELAFERMMFDDVIGDYHCIIKCSQRLGMSRLEFADGRHSASNEKFLESCRESRSLSSYATQDAIEESLRNWPVPGLTKVVLHGVPWVGSETG